MARFARLAEAQAALRDPATSPDDLMAIVEAQPDLWPEVARHPGVYQELLDYLWEYGDEATRAAIDDVPAPADVPADVPAPAEAPAEAPEGVDTAPSLPVVPALADPGRGRVAGWVRTPLLDVPPDLFVPTEPPALPVAGPTPPPTPDPAPVPPTPAASPRRRQSNWTLIIILAAVIALVAVGTSVYLGVIRPRGDLARAEADFTTASTEHEHAQADLNAALQAAGLYDGRYTADEVSTEATTALATAADQAKPAVVPTPEPAADAPALRAQIAQMAGETTAAGQATAKLTAAMGNVDASVRQIGTDKLTAAIADAQTAWDASAGLVKDESVRTTLSDAISTANTALAGLSEADPQDVVKTVADQIQALSTATAAISGNQKTQCPGGVVLPTGIDPMVCGGMPATAIVPQVPDGAGNTQVQFAMPSGNVGCTKQAYDVAALCEIIRKDWTLPETLAPACAANDPRCDGGADPALKGGQVTYVRHTDVGPWTNNRAADPPLTIPVLAYGQVANFAPVACLSHVDGVVCWDTSTHHGFRMSVTTFDYW
ncbi:MAG: hypothetical protein LBI33_04650 [Propionibacteriaceae bacterium]|jgi:hypothetical protein|nr:hypothetical protein [Propionibacteriaceae bacterium]